jgi:tRNA (guanine-N(7)-)-methyltransferase
MRLRRNPKAKLILESHPEYVILDSSKHKNKFKELFSQQELPLHIEIGMGKGGFLIEMAKKNPDINFIGIEKYDSVMVVALTKLLKEAPLNNLKLMLSDAKDLKEVFAENEISQLYLNFSDPWPKSRHAKRRLTYIDFLKVYQFILKNNSQLILKTDHRTFFESSLVSFNQFDLSFNDLCLDLHNSEGYDYNVQTEYEKKFSKNGPIYRIEVLFNEI